MISSERNMMLLELCVVRVVHRATPAKKERGKWRALIG